MEMEMVTDTASFNYFKIKKLSISNAVFLFLFRHQAVDQEEEDMDAVGMVEIMAGEVKFYKQMFLFVFFDQALDLKHYFCFLFLFFY